ncbi:MAG TPA: hypothetical protein PKD37_04860 [Oligoflexia bacterium]|nr:hypothetical protein [Oligoflexia bacterium]HMP27296.1 hypothetical protein [Oligoflexia bacterium]
MCAADQLSETERLLESSPKREFSISRQSQKEIANSLGISPTSKYYPQLLENLSGQKITPITSGFRTKVNPNAKIVAHLRANQGIPLPLPSEIPSLASNKEAVNAALAELDKQNEYELQLAKVIEKMQAPPRKLDICKRDHKRALSHGPKNLRPPLNPGENPNQLLMDILFLPAEMIPDEIQGQFGEEVFVMEYIAGERIVGSALAEIFQANCLPTRIQVTDGATTTLEGLEALKNPKNGKIDVKILSKFRELQAKDS